MSFPKSYKAAQFEEAGGDLKIVDVDWKDPQPGHIIVKTLACGVCHSDAIVKHAQMGVQLPHIPGHEIVGDVVKVADGEKQWKVGDRVGSGWHGGHCFTCDECRSGRFTTCASENINGIMTAGGYGEYVHLRSEAVASIPKEMDPAEAAPLLCAGVTTFNSIRNMNIRPGEVAAVQGVGGLGHLAIQFCRQMGLRTVAVSRGTDKKDLAMKLGAHDYIDSEKEDACDALNKMGGAKVIVAVAPSGKAMSSLINGLAVDGQLIILAVADDLAVPCAPMIMKRRQVRGWPSGSARDSEETVAFANMMNVKCAIEKFPLSKVNEAYQAMESGKVRFRAVLDFTQQ